MSDVGASNLRVGRYALRNVVGEGGMGTVWEAFDPSHERRVAVKFFPYAWHRSRNTEFLEHEAEAISAVRHPHVVELLDQGRIEAREAIHSKGRLVAGTPYFVMEFVEGGALSTVRASEVNWASVREVLDAVLSALAHLHARGLVHSDIKPSNILVAPSFDQPTRVKLCDFGVARWRAANAGGLAGGTAQFMAPEQLSGSWEEVGPWTDLYAFGCTVWAVVTGTPPFVDVEPEMRLAAVLPEFRPRFAVPKGLEAWVRALLVPSPHVRIRHAAHAQALLADVGLEVEPDLVYRDPAAMEAALLDRDTTLHGGFEQQLLTGGFDTTRVGGVQTGWVSFEVSHNEEPDVLATLGDRFRVATTDWRSILNEGVEGCTDAEEDMRDAIWSALTHVEGAGQPRFTVVEAADADRLRRATDGFVRAAYELGVVHVMPDFDGSKTSGWRKLRAMVLKYLGVWGSVPAKVRARLDVHPVMKTLSATDRRTLIEGLLSPGNRGADGVLEPEFVLTVRRLLAAFAEDRPLVIAAGEALARDSVIDLVKQLADAEDVPLRVLTVAWRTTGTLASTQAASPDYAQVVALAPPRQTDGNGGMNAAVREDPAQAWRRFESFLATRSGSDRDAMEIAAMMGREVSVDEWRAVCAYVQVVSAPGLFEAAEQAGCVERATWSTEEAYAFMSERVRMALIRQAESSGRGSKWHEACMQVQEDEGSAAGRIRHEMHAHHAGIGGTPLDSIVAVARDYADRGDDELALALLDGVESILATPSRDAVDGNWAMCLALRGLCLSRQGDVAGARDAAAYVLEFVGGTGEHPDAELIATWTAYRLDHWLLSYDDAKRVLARIEELEATRPGDGDLAIVWAERGELAVYHGDIPGAERAFSAAVAAFDEAKWPMAAAECLKTLAQSCFAAQEMERSLRYTEDALERHALSQDAPAEAINLHVLRGEILRALGRTDEAFATFQEAIDRALKAGESAWLPALHLTFARVLRGSSEESDSMLTEAAKGQLPRDLSATVRAAWIASAATLGKWDELDVRIVASHVDVTSIGEPLPRVLEFLEFGARACESAGQPVRAQRLRAWLP